MKKLYLCIDKHFFLLFTISNQVFQTFKFSHSVIKLMNFVKILLTFFEEYLINYTYIITWNNYNLLPCNNLI